MKKKILIVEDDITIAKIYATRFREEGFEVETQTDGAAALERISSYHPNAMLLDLDLPTVHGLDVIRRVRVQPMLRSLPIVVFSNAFQHTLIAEAWEAGASMCLIKASSTPAQVVAAVRNAMSQAAHPTSNVARPTTPPPVVSPPTPVPRAKADPAFQAEIIKSFVRQTAESLVAMRPLWRQFLSSKDPALQISLWGQLQRKVHAITVNAAMSEFLPMANMSSAFEALLKELCERPASINPSTLRTVGSTMDFLANLLEWAGKDWPEQLAASRVLVVDDEFVARKAAESALQLMNVTPTTADSPEGALTLLQANPYDLILLDVDLPGMNGFDVCNRLRTLPAHQTTPVIFVTGMTSFENRAQSTLSGGNDLIGKPFLVIELAVKALIYLLRRQLQGRAIEKQDHPMAPQPS